MDHQSFLLFLVPLSAVSCLVLSQFFYLIGIFFYYIFLDYMYGYILFLYFSLSISAQPATIKDMPYVCS